jgi:hypothetical protein
MRISIKRVVRIHHRRTNAHVDAMAGASATSFRDPPCSIDALT